MTYDPADDARKSYDEAVAELRKQYRVELIGDALLIQGDCLKVMPMLGKVDHVITDPPYEDELHKAIGRIRRKDGRQMIDDLGFDGVNASRAEIAKAIVQAATGWSIVFTLAEGVRAWRDDMQAVGAKWDTTCFWVKPDASPRFNGQGPARGAECFVTAWCGPGYRKWNAGGKRGVYTHCVNTNRHGIHPTEKPVPLMTEIVGDFTQYRDLVLDPFCGSGTTGIACLRLGRRFIGIERDPKYFDVACERVEKASRQADLFVAAPAEKPVQQPLFGEAAE